MMCLSASLTPSPLHSGTCSAGAQASGCEHGAVQSHACVSRVNESCEHGREQPNPPRPSGSRPGGGRDAESSIWASIWLRI